MDIEIMSYATYTKLDRQSLKELLETYHVLWVHERPDLMLLVSREELQKT
jgi:hypothetical protein